MKKLSLFIVIAVITLISSNSCKKDFQPGEFPIPQEVLDYFYFKPGSMWVYENDKTGEKDTIIVQKANKYWFDGSNGDKYEKAETHFLNLRDGYTYRYYCSTQGSSYCIRRNGREHTCYTVFCEKFKPGNYIGESIMLRYKFIPGVGGFIGPKDSSTLEIKEFVDSLDVKSIYYKNVCKVFINYCLVFNDKKINFFWAKEVGLIKYEDITKQEKWNLIYYHIVK